MILPTALNSAQSAEGISREIITAVVSTDIEIIETEPKVLLIEDEQKVIMIEVCK